MNQLGSIFSFGQKASVTVNVFEISNEVHQCSHRKQITFTTFQNLLRIKISLLLLVTLNILQEIIKLNYSTFKRTAGHRWLTILFMNRESDQVTVTVTVTVTDDATAHYNL